jgi:hypothetical protein
VIKEETGELIIISLFLFDFQALNKKLFAPP